MATPRRTTSRTGRSARPDRPGAARSRARSTRPRSGGENAAAAPARRRPRYTNRMAVLVVVFAVLVVSYASSMRAYLRQHSHISELRAQIASAKDDIRQLRKEQRRWHDKAYVEQQARARFGWVMPGETAYQVIGADGRPISDRHELHAPVSSDPAAPEAWWSRAYDSLERADHPEDYVRHKPSPAKRIVPGDGPGGKNSGGRDDQDPAGQ